MSDEPLSPSTQKVFLNTLEKIRSMIQEDRLLPGDKLPSERELAERLSVGRSSVREALRALELLGIIETRRGEGTFIQDVRENHLIPLLGAFILQDTIAKKDLLEMNEMLEINAIMLILKHRPYEKLAELESCAKELDAQSIMASIIQRADNFLLYRIWSVLHQFVRAVLPPSIHRSKSETVKLLHYLLNGDEKKAICTYRQLSYKYLYESKGAESE